MVLRASILTAALVATTACATRSAPEPTGAEAGDEHARPNVEHATAASHDRCDEADLVARWERIAREQGMELQRSGNDLVTSRGDGRQVVLRRRADECQYAIRDQEDDERAQWIGMLRLLPHLTAR